jgi:hypothetical protein
MHTFVFTPKKKTTIAQQAPVTSQEYHTMPFAGTHSSYPTERNINKLRLIGKKPKINEIVYEIHARSLLLLQNYSNNNTACTVGNVAQGQSL